MKKVIIVIIALILISNISETILFADNLEDGIKLTESFGDINNDGKTNAKDVTELMKYNVGAIKDINHLKADVNVDGKINAKDVIEIMKGIVNQCFSQKTWVLRKDEEIEEDRVDILSLFYYCQNKGFEYYDEEYIFIPLVIDPRWYLDGRITTNSDILNLFSAETREMFSSVKFYQAQPMLLDESKLGTVTWDLHLKYEFRDYLEQIITELSTQECVLTCSADCYRLPRTEGWVRR